VEKPAGALNDAPARFSMAFFPVWQGFAQDINDTNNQDRSMVTPRFGSTRRAARRHQVVPPAPGLCLDVLDLPSAHRLRTDCPSVLVVSNTPPSIH
jgi:hypothetical protein